MPNTLRGRHFLCLKDFTREEIEMILDLAIHLKRLQYLRQPHPLLVGKTLGMVFQKSSTRTRVSFETGIYQLGGMGLYLSGNDLQLGRGETVADTARVLSSYLDGIMARVFAHDDIVTLAKYSTVPVINGLSDFNHPCQIVADLQTILEHFKHLDGLKLTYVGDGNNVCHSLLFGCTMVGMSVSVACPKGYLPDKDVVKYATETAKRYGQKVEIVHDPVKGVKNSDVIYTDVWTSMGQEKEAQERLKRFKGFQVNEKLLAAAADSCIALHCLPAHRGEEITDGVVDGPQSRIFQEAENRLHAQKAIMALTM